ncbi:MAG: hypothetical protein RSA97_05990 [Oscillospiraceae bacterium]
MANRKTVEAVFRPLDTPAKAAVPFSGVPAEVVAAISGAVAFMFGGNARPVEIKKSKRESAGGRGAWSMAGLLDNTSAF